ncbi:MAG: DUF2309 domain-containing protein [Erythrobacter sp.]|jgi:uncharacterized protein YbcC (UPF0753/DUF2309 family)|nr:DUF2309 domain-containing protein [Erythrobacter sp.]
MFLKHTQIQPARMGEMLASAEAAARHIPPSFPLDATVAVNPFLGQTGEDLATASARIARVAGVRLTQTGADYSAAIKEGRITDEDLEAALAASASPLKHTSIAALKLAAAAMGDAPGQKALPTLADLAAAQSGIDWPSVIEKTFGQWATGHFDRGQALWSPTPGADAFGAWRAYATHDLTPEIAGLEGFCAHVAGSPDTTERAIVAAADAIGIGAEAAQTVFHRLYMSLGGWSQHARWLLWQAELIGEGDRTLADLLAIRLIWEEALLAHYPGIADEWTQILAAHAARIEPSQDQVALAILQEAADRAYQRRLIAALDGSDKVEEQGRPQLQAAFCIDVRSEVFRRALESVDRSIETIGFAGFFGLPIAHHPHGSDLVEARLPVLLNPAMTTTSKGDPAKDHDTRIAARTSRAWGRFRQAAVSSFAFVESMGPLYAAKLVRDALGGAAKAAKPDPLPSVVGGMDAATKADTAAAVLGAMSMTAGFAEVVLLLGHGGSVTNNPHESAYHCGACGGYKGDVSARVLAVLLNDPEAREGLAQRGIHVPEDTVFIAGLHDTTTDTITLYDGDLADLRGNDLGTVRGWLGEATGIARAERAPRLPSASAQTIARRATNWAEVRPEWGLAGCAAFIAGPRDATVGKDLGGRSFLHSYDWRADAEFKTLELIMTAPVVVASWISLQYYGSSVAPEVFGGGNKLIHNVVGGIGVIEGNGGQLRPGLPWQAVHDGDKLMHEPLRLSVMVEAPREALLDILERHEGVRALFDNRWLHLFVLEGGKVAARYEPGLTFAEVHRPALAA